MSRIAAARELQDVIGKIQQLSERGIRLAEASGALVDPLWFRGSLNNATMAAGDLDSKGLLDAPAQVVGKGG